MVKYTDKQQKLFRTSERLCPLFFPFHQQHRSEDEDISRKDYPYGLPGRESGVVRYGEVDECMGHEQCHGMCADEGNGAVYPTGRAGNGGIDKTADIIECHDTAIGEQRPQQIVSREEYVAMMSHDGAAQQQEGQISGRTDNKQPPVSFIAGKTVTHHEKRNSHQNVRYVKRQRISRQMKRESAGHTDRNDGDGSGRPGYEVSGYDTHEKQRQNEPCRNIDGDISVSAECGERGE